ncbi:MAG: hypothetical protein ABSH48_24905, partial [Verrucomicrobiota bacterium]
KQQQLEAQVQAHQVELGNLATRTQELKAAQSALAELKNQLASVNGQVQSLNESLKTESSHRATAEQQAAELAKRRTQLEQEVAKRSKSQEQLRAELAAKQQQLEAQVQTHQVELGNLATRTQELEAARAASAKLKNQLASVSAHVQSLTESLAAESGRRATADQRAADLAKRRTQLEQEVADRSKSQEQLRAELGTLATRTQELKTAQTALTELKIQLTNAKRQFQSLTESLSAQSDRHAASERQWLARESELQSNLKAQQVQIEKSGTTLASREIELNEAGGKIKELQAVQSAMRAEVQALTATAEKAVRVVQDWKAKAMRSEGAIENAQRTLAELRYCVLDASRMSTRLQRERLQKEFNNFEAVRKTIASMAQTPLSLVQRGILAELQNAMDGLNKSQRNACRTEVFRVDPPNFRDSEFCFAAVTESAFDIVRAAAQAAGVAVRVSASGNSTGTLVGYAEQVHQLITLLAVSTLTIMTRVRSLDLRVAVEAGRAGFEDLTVRVALATDCKVEDSLARLNWVTAAAASLQTAEFDETELGLATGWQLAHAMGAQVTVEGNDSQEVCLMLSLPLKKDARLSAPDFAPAPALSANGNGHNQKLTS